MNEERIRVVVVDDHLVVRDGLRMMLEMIGKDFVLVGEAADGATALRVVEKTQPEVVLMDIRMPGMDGLEALKQIRARWPQIAVVILTTYNEDELVLQGLQAGAYGYLLKDTQRETLFQTVRAASQGTTLLQPDIMTRLLSRTISPGQIIRQATQTDAPKRIELTEREQDVLDGVARGERSKEIAARLGISTTTVVTHLSSIYAKLQVDSRASALMAALELGLLPRRQ